MLESLFWVILVGGFPVIFSYIYIYYNGSNKLWGDLQDVKFGLWVLSALFTVVSYLYLFWYFVFENTMHEAILCALYVTFLTSASQWSLFAIADILYDEKSLFLWINLMVTSAASLGICVMTFVVGEDYLSWACGIMMFVHHFFFDGIVWYNGFLDYSI